MSSDQLSLFSYEILGLVGHGGAGAHDLLRMARRARILAWAGESQYYVEPRRLAKLGYLAAHVEPGKTRPRTVYTLTDAGLEALRSWAGTPIGFTPFKSEFLIRILIADLVGDDATRRAVGTLRGEIDDLRRRLDESDDEAAALPHRSENLLLASGFLRRLLDLHEEWIDRIDPPADA